MNVIEKGLIYSIEYNTLYYSNEFLISSGKSILELSNDLGIYAEYISDDDRDILYAKSKGVAVFSDKTKEYDKTLLYNIDVDRRIKNLKQEFKEFETEITEEYEFLNKNKHNITLLKIAFIIKYHIDMNSNGVYLMRGSGISSLILYLIGLNKVNPIKFNLDYKNFWK